MFVSQGFFPDKFEKNSVWYTDLITSNKVLLYIPMNVYGLQYNLLIWGILCPGEEKKKMQQIVQQIFLTVVLGNTGECRKEKEWKGYFKHDL